MQIDLFEFQPARESEPVSLGLNLSKNYGLTTASLFVISENRGTAVSKHLWPIAQKITNEVLIGEKIGDVNWSLTCCGRTSMIKFTTLDDKPCKIDLSDIQAVRYENLDHQPNRQRGQWSYPLEKYASEFDGWPPENISKGRRLTLTKAPEPVSMFTVPIHYDGASDRLYHCIPSFYDADHMRSDYVFILADTHKVCRILENNNSDFLKRPLNASSAMERLESNSLTSPDDMGAWTISMHRGLTMSSGYGEYLLMAKDLRTPYFPMALEKAMGEARIKNIWETVGYGAKPHHSPMQDFQPVFNPS